MTRALDTAIARIATLPPDEQDRIAQWLLDELNDEDRWTEQFANSRDSLSRLADEARSERETGKATQLDPGKSVKPRPTPRFRAAYHELPPANTGPFHRRPIREAERVVFSRSSYPMNFQLSAVADGVLYFKSR